MADLTMQFKLNPDSKPGLPYQTYITTNKVIREDPFVRAPLVEIVVARMKLILSREPPSDALECVKQGFSDPVKVFVKDEPHSLKKRKEGRYRLIEAISVVDQVIERLLFGKQNQAEIDQIGIFDNQTQPSQPGLNLAGNGPLVALRERLLSTATETAKPVSADITGFDFSVRENEIAWDAKTRLMLCNASHANQIITMRRAKIFCYSLLTLSDGSMFSLLIPGMMLSGSYITSSTNSRIRWFLARLAGAARAFAMGDDCVETFSESAEQIYSDLGHPLKMYDILEEDKLEFCSMEFHSSDPHDFYPTNPAKTFFNLLNGKLSRERVEAFMFVLRDHPGRQLFVDFLKGLGAYYV